MAPQLAHPRAVTRLLLAALTAAAGQARPVSGPDSPANAPYDEVISALMDRYEVPCGAVAVTREGRLVVARGYGPAEPDGSGVVSPTTLFRIASVSKPVTAVAVMKLVEAGRLGLDDRAFDHLADLLPAAGPADRRVRAITIRQLLQHTAGWDREAAFDPMFRPAEAAAAVGAPAPADARTVIRYMLGQPLQHDPGTRHSYSNFGYCVLGRVIEQVTGQPYETWVRESVLAPVGLRRPRLGRSLLAHRARGEGWYAVPAGRQPVKACFPLVGELVPAPYGSFHVEAMDAHGGWLFSAVDLVRFALHLDGRPDPPDLLQATTLATMRRCPPPPLPQEAAAWSGLGFMVRPVGEDANWWHGGSMPGTTSLLVRTHHGYTWAAIFNLQPPGGTFAGQVDRAMWQALAKVEAWPEQELVVD